VLHILLAGQRSLVVVVLPFAERRIYIVFLDPSSDFSKYLVLELFGI
jgi:hypothetical protein